MNIKVLLVDDHPVVRAGLRALLDGLTGVSVVAEAQDAPGAVERSLHGDIDVVVMDIQMGPGPTGIDATRRIRAGDGPPVLILTTYDTQSDILAALDAGAIGYMLKDAPPESLGTAVLDAAAGRPVLSPQVTAQLVARSTQPTTALSPREIEILQLAATGATNKAMAKKLFISEATVKTHLVHVYDKLGVDNRTAAIDQARQQRII